MMTEKISYPKEWDKLSKNIRKKKIKLLKKEIQEKSINNKSKIKMGIIFIIVSSIILGGIYWQQLPKPEKLGESYSIEGREHINEAEEVDYQTNPPTSGDHHANATEWGIYENEIEDKEVVHALEHGGIWISYKDLTKEEIIVLEKIANKNKNSVVLSPRSKNDYKISVASWGRLIHLQEIDVEKIELYIKQNINKSPEKLVK
jgi:hypothetical protein